MTKIKANEKWFLLNEKYGKYICEKYQQKHTLLTDLSKEMGTTNYTIKKILKFNNIPEKSVHEVATEVNSRGRFKQRTHDLDYNYFKTWSDNMAYILGFLYADGYIKKNTLRINLQRRDRYLLERIKSELRFSGDVKDNNVKETKNGMIHESSYLSITSIDLTSDLRNLGLYENKSLTLSYPYFLPKEHELAFIRGYFDGDGSIEVKRQIHKTKNSDTYQLRLRICSGSYDMLDGMQKALTRYGLKSKKVNYDKRGNLKEIAYSTKESYKLYDLLYGKECHLFLKRKKEKFEEGFKLRSNK